MSILTISGKKVFFVHPPRCSGSSIETEVEEYKGNNKLVDPPEKHFTSTDYKNEYPEWGRSFKFGIIRNPFDTMVSKYKTGWYGGRPDLCSFGNFVTKRYHRKQHEHGETLCDYLREEVDFIIRYETRKENLLKLNNIFDSIGIDMKFSGDLVEGFTIEEQPGVFYFRDMVRREYRDFYDWRTRRIVTKMYREDLDRFGYGF